MRFIVVIVVANLEDTKFLAENILMAPHCIVPLVILKQQLVTLLSDCSASMVAITSSIEANPFTRLNPSDISF